MAQIIRVRTLVTGVVQGVGFRPHIARTAARHPVTGLVGNDDREVFIEAQGTREAVHSFLDEALGTLPPLAKITGRRETPVSPVEGEEIFRIVASERASGERTLIPPDSATCPDCLAELHDPDDRRYHHPFITCTNCGPRYSIITDLPYDRPNTTMAGFPMCPRCAAEYADPLDRRFHAQPVACPDCGPTMWLERDGERLDGEPDELFALARAELDRGGALAVKGIGGFHLLADARNPEAVALLRERKHRPDKPFAVMAPRPEEVAGFTDAELELVHSPAAPIVIGRDLGVLAAGVAPRLGEVGVMRPYSPLHELLVDRPVIATSGNVPGEPVCHTNDAARAKLARLVDLFVLHDRPIHLPVEDSVFRGTRPVRRGRGFAPLPLRLPLDDAAPADVACVLAVGGELKNAFTLAVGKRANVAGHLGDMASLAGRRAFDASTADMLTMQRATPTGVACDLHPGYSTRAWAERFAEEHDVPLIGVQHHHAHARSLLAEHEVTGRAVVAVVDGTGFGTDATVWGGEVLAVDASGPDWPAGAWPPRSRRPTASPGSTPPSCGWSTRSWPRARAPWSAPRRAASSTPRRSSRARSPGRSATRARRPWSSRPWRARPVTRRATPGPPRPGRPGHRRVPRRTLPPPRTAPPTTTARPSPRCSPRWPVAPPPSRSAPGTSTAASPDSSPRASRPRPNRPARPWSG